MRGVEPLSVLYEGTALPLSYTAVKAFYHNKLLDAPFFSGLLCKYAAKR